MYRTREYRRDIRNRKIARKKRVSREIYHMDWFPIDGKYSKGHIGCGCKICKFSKHYNLPLLYEIKDKEYVNQWMKEFHNSSYDELTE